MDLLCRTCTGPADQNHVKIFGSGVFKQLIICSSLDCDESDQFPKQICKNCSKKLKSFYEFRMMCIQSINTFNEMIKGGTSMKTTESQEVEIKKMKTEMFESEIEMKAQEDQLEAHSPIGADMFEDFVTMEEEYLEENPLRESDNEEESEESEFDEKPDINELSGKKKKYFECLKCAKKFVKEERLGNHMRIHEGLKPFPCSQCPRSYMKLANLNTHIKESHRINGEKLVIPCTAEGCDKIFDKRHSLLAHLRYKHSNKVRPERTYICETCGKTFKTSWSLKEHSYLHTGEETYPYKCDQCSKKFIAQKAFKEHLLRHSGIKNFECSYCGMKKTTARELRTHLNYHTKEKQWPCPLCPSVFNARGNLKLHNDRVHLGIKNYNCQYCDQSFSKSETLKHHEMTHTGEKPHGCPICEKRFIQAIALKTHMKTHNK
ncbi:hypothetical protein ACFFRR_002208 [Megaselia abdita]